LKPGFAPGFFLGDYFFASFFACVFGAAIYRPRRIADVPNNGQIVALAIVYCYCTAACVIER
jgi:hypothetical protein